MQQPLIMEANKTILVTGASGFIGNFIVDECLKRGFRVFAAVRKSTDLSKLGNRQVELVTIDYEDPIGILDTISRFPRFDYVIHNAGITKTTRSHNFLKVNYHYTKNLILALSEPSVLPDKFIFISSLAARGPVQVNGESGQDSYPQSLYGKSKLLAENYICEQKYLKYVILRPTAVYGPGDQDFLKILRVLKHGIDLQIGASDRKLSFIYVKDLARLILDAVVSDKVDRTYLATDGYHYSQVDFGRNAALAFNKKQLKISVPVAVAKFAAACSELFAGITGKASVINMDNIVDLSASDWSCDITPAVSELGFKAEYDLRLGLKETIDWYKQQGWL